MTTPTMSYTGLQNLVTIGRVTTLVVNMCIHCIDSVRNFTHVFIITMCYHDRYILHWEVSYGGTYLNVHHSFILTASPRTADTPGRGDWNNKQTQHTVQHYYFPLTASLSTAIGSLPHYKHLYLTIPYKSMFLSSKVCKHILTVLHTQRGQLPLSLHSHTPALGQNT